MLSLEKSIFGNGHRNVKVFSGDERQMEDRNAHETQVNHGYETQVNHGYTKLKQSLFKPIPLVYGAHVK